MCKGWARTTNVYDTGNNLEESGNEQLILKQQLFQRDPNQVVNVFDAYCDPLTSQAMQHCASVRTPTNAEPKKLEQTFHICISDGYCKLAFQTCMSNWHSNRQVKFAFQICIPTWHFILSKHRISNWHTNAFQIILYALSILNFPFILAFQFGN